MTYQYINLGTAPSGAGGDTFRSTGTKLNENFTNSTHAASRYVGINDSNLVEKQNIGYAALTAKPMSLGSSASLDDLSPGDCVFCDTDVGKPINSPIYSYSAVFTKNLDTAGTNGRVQIAFDYLNSNMAFRSKGIGSGWQPWAYTYTNLNTTVDSNGFVKKASPVVQLFAEKISANDEALEHEPLFEKVDIGHYLLKNTEGFSDDGWYIEMPKDANGNVLVAVQYQQLEDNTIEVKTYSKKFDEETGDIVPNLEKPRDIPIGRWIDIRLKALPQPEIEISNTPLEFQPTNLAQTVTEALKDDSEQ